MEVLRRSRKTTPSPEYAGAGATMACACVLEDEAVAHQVRPLQQRAAALDLPGLSQRSYQAKHQRREPRVPEQIYHQKLVRSSPAPLSSRPIGTQGHEISSSFDANTNNHSLESNVHENGTIRKYTISDQSTKLCKLFAIQDQKRKGVVGSVNS